MPRRLKASPPPGTLGHHHSAETKAKIAAGRRAFFARLGPVAASVTVLPEPAPAIDQQRINKLSPARRERLERVALPFQIRIRCRLTGRLFEFTHAPKKLARHRKGE